MKAKIVVVLVAVAAIILMFQLPRYVVDNERKMEADEPSNTSRADFQENTSHNTLTDPVIINRIDSVKRLWVVDNYSEKNATFADYLAKQYLQSSKYDSAILYFEWLMEHFPNVSVKADAADAYYQAFGFEMDPGQRKEYAGKARSLYEELLAEDEGNLSLKNKLAMTYMASTNPMQGIMMLRSIVEEDPDNAEALLNLGILAIQTGQFDRAEQHLSELVKYHPDHYQGHLLLGAAQLEHGHTEEARQHFEIVKDKGDDPALVEAAENYLRDI